MLEPQDRMNKFLDAIEKEAQDKRKAIGAELDRRYQTEVAKAQKAANVEAAAVLKKETARINEVNNARVAEFTTALRTKLSGQRTQILRDILEQAGNKLAAFTKTEDYLPFLEESLKVLAPSFQSPDTILFLHPNDMKLADTLLSLLGCGRAEPDETIRWGGLKLRSEALRRAADDTLETRLLEQREWLKANCNLSISLS